MLRFVLRRIVYIIPTLIAVSLISFFVIALPPGDFVDRMAIEAAKKGDYMTGAEIEAVLLSAIGFAELRGSVTITDEDVKAASDDFIPSRDAAMMRYMELLAVFECSSRRMLPERYRRITSTELNAEVREQQRRLLRP